MPPVRGGLRKEIVAPSSTLAAPRNLIGDDGIQHFLVDFEHRLPGWTRQCCLIRVDGCLVDLRSGLKCWFSHGVGPLNELPGDSDERIFVLMRLNLFQGPIKVVLSKVQPFLGAEESLFDDALCRMLIFALPP